jgi:branched-chain amino acid transport system substrate-binding protein
MSNQISVKKVTFLLIIISMAVLPCMGNAGAISPPDTIKVGSVIALTGRYASGGKDVYAGYELALEHLNRNGGVYIKDFGKKIPIQLIVLDDESDSVKTVSRLDKLYSIDNVYAYLGGFSSLLNIVGMSAGEKNKVPWIGVTIAVEAPFRKGYRYCFAPFSMSTQIVETFLDCLDTISENQRPRKIAHLELNIDWGQECGDHLRELTKKRGYKVVVDEKYAAGTNDFSSLIFASKSAGTDALFSVSSPPQSLAIVKQMKELNYAPKATYLVSGPDISTYWDSMGKDANYILSSMNWGESLPFPGNKKLVEDYHARYPDIKFIGNPVGAAYAAVQILADAIERAGTLDREKIREAIAATDMITVKGPVKFKKDGTGIILFGLRQWQNGDQEVVFPLKYSTAPLLLAPPWDKR